ncbi:MAG: hypothetical protein A2Y41_07215 [Spirochaetes bacterium GWB1_36_13]|nr:MAG: hypothetical protein A2Y41_07215 [Spirochaetes bacterium GWB1_36_13]
MERNIQFDYIKLLKHFGIEKQLKKTREELIELLAVLDKWIEGREFEARVLNEIADVKIMIEQLSLIFGIETVEKAVCKKIDRTFKRIEEGYYQK